MITEFMYSLSVHQEMMKILEINDSEMTLNYIETIDDFTGEEQVVLPQSMCFLEAVCVDLEVFAYPMSFMKSSQCMKTRHYRCHITKSTSLDLQNDRTALLNE